MANRLQLGTSDPTELQSPQLRRILTDHGIPLVVKPVNNDTEEGDVTVFKTPPRGALTPKMQLKVDKSPPRTPGTAPTTPVRAPVKTPVPPPHRRPLRETIVSRVEERLADVEIDCRKQIESMFAEFTVRLTQQLIAQRQKQQQ